MEKVNSEAWERLYVYPFYQRTCSYKCLIYVITKYNVINLQITQLLNMHNVHTIQYNTVFQQAILGATLAVGLSR